MAETNKNLWAPWRMAYIRSLSDKDQGGCFLCRYAASPDEDPTNHVIWRGASCLTTFNTFPYSSGHLLVTPQAHLADIDDLDDGTLHELMTQVKNAKRLLKEATKAQGFNIGMNFGRCAGAGLPGHLHVHVVPRWEGDSNFMSVVGDVRVVSQSIEALHEEMRRIAPGLGLPEIRGA
jgi:ATP adenylyltransferase